MSRLSTHLVVALVLTVSLTACGQPDDPSASEPGTEAVNSNRRTVRVQTATVSPSTFTDVIQITGDVEAIDDATLSSQTAGTIVYLADLGTFVRRGQLVARIDPGITDAGVEQAEAQVTAAKAQYDLALDTFKRQEPLYRDSVISALEFESVRTQMNQAEAQLKQSEAFLAQAREQSRYTRITAPFSGRVETQMVERGEQVVPGAPVARLVNTARVKITAGVPERYAGDIENGSTVRVDFADYGLGTVEAQASFVGRVIDRASRTFPIEIEIDNAQGKLKPEMIAKVMVTRDQLTDVLVVPLSAVMRDENGTNVFVAETRGGETVAVRRAVRVGPTHSGKTVILDGLESDDRLVTAGQNLLTPGDALEIVEDDSESAPSEDADQQPTALTSSS
ncbi:MAG: efflux RND transporter periplasmic adaptor subunit [Rhodothermia bacterium]|nr:efflux RND transporter periplasmic adaptor subunit [Rhodothermia bacterium]